MSRRNKEPFGRWLIRQLIAVVLVLVPILVLANVLPEVIGEAFRTVAQPPQSP